MERPMWVDDMCARVNREAMFATLHWRNC
jgi:hypothetical protein